MANNTTIWQEIEQDRVSTDLLSNDYDSAGAIMFIIVVLFWYSMGMVCMLVMQIKARDETVGTCPKRRAKFLIDTLCDQTRTKQILGSYLFIYSLINSM